MARMEITQGNTTEAFVGSTDTLVALLRSRLAGDGLLVTSVTAEPAGAAPSAATVTEGKAEITPLSLRTGFTVSFDPTRG